MATDIETNPRLINNWIFSSMIYLMYLCVQINVLIAKYLKIIPITLIICRIIYKPLSFAFFLITIFFSSLFIYVMFFNNFVPLVSMTKEIHFQYDSTCDSGMSAKCNIPFSQFDLRSDSRTGRELSIIRGQTYKFSIDLRLPESEINWSQGLFMIRIKLFDDNKRVVVNVAKPSILRFKSGLMRVVHNLFYWPLLVIGVIDESQTLRVTLIEDFVDMSLPNVGPITGGIIEIEARNIQISPPTLLRINAQLIGLKYLMYYWPLCSATFGTLFISIFVSFWYFILKSYHKRCVNIQEEFVNQNESEIYEPNKVYDKCSESQSHLIDGELSDGSDSEDNNSFVKLEVDDFHVYNEPIIQL